jgi:processive 1,2-diacylglycerol beta-glucosyltransferase
VVDRLRIRVLYEYGIDGRPHSSSFVRLLRPLTHPTVRGRVDVATGVSYEGEGADAVVVDRLWRPDVSMVLAKELVDRVRQAGARLVYFLDDNLLDLPNERSDWPSAEQVAVVELFLRRADVVVVTTPALRDRVSSYNLNTAVLRNALDERLLVGGAGSPERPWGRSGEKVIGYMGTRSHDADLMMVLPALRGLARRRPGEFEIQLVGVAASPETVTALGDLPVRLVEPEPEEVEYPLFMLWFSSQLAWDIAIAPLRNTPFGRCKSDIKFLDYSAIGAVSVCSRGPAYEGSVRPGETGWLAEDDPAAWEEALDCLLRNDEQRELMARAASGYLWSERILVQCAPQWLAVLEKACGRI